MPKRWIIAPFWPGCAEACHRAGNLSPLVMQLLHNRGLSEPATAQAFLRPELKTLHPPDLLHGATAAAEIIAGKVRDRRPIVIYGDYDVDGITATAILWHLLKLTGASVSSYVPHRLEEGYGLNADALRKIAAGGADTVITVDCGITAVQEAAVAREAGLTLIITDHHLPGPVLGPPTAMPDGWGDPQPRSTAAGGPGPLPEADVIVHPGIGSYPDANLCGAGVAFKLAWAIALKLSQAERVTPEFRDFLLDATSLAALGTIADVVPLLGENRVLTRFGLSGLRESKLVGLQALIAAANLGEKTLDADDVGFRLAPRLNAAGRLGHAGLAVELLTEAGPERAREIAAQLETSNRQRQTRERAVFEQACEMIEDRGLAGNAHRAIVLAAEGWHAGVIGIVASRVVERYSRPTILIALENGLGQGSGRSIRNFQMHQALCDCSKYLLAFGGHALAAGLRIEREQVEAFAEAFIARANQLLTAQDLEPSLRLDAEVRLDDLTEPVVRDIERLAPFGTGNPRPRFASPVLRLEGEPRPVGKRGEHLQFSLSDGRTRRKAIAFGQSRLLQPLLDHRRCRVAFEPILNTFNGRTSVEMQVIDVRFDGPVEK
jgi:single-stranded-DNA-specific exonuclease